jgi:hypothetical protein
MTEIPTPTLPDAGGWYQNQLFPWIQNQELVGYGIGMFLLAGKLARIPTIFVLFLYHFPKNLFYLKVLQYFWAWESTGTKTKFKN